MIVTPMQSVPIEKDITTVLAMMDIQAMVLTAQVYTDIFRISISYMKVYVGHMS